MLPLDPKSMEQIFATQGPNLTDEQLEAFIVFCRAERERLAAAESAGKRGQRAAADKPATIDKAELLKLID